MMSPEAVRRRLKECLAALSIAKLARTVLQAQRGAIMTARLSWLRYAARTAMYPPERIVCLTEETVETLYLLGEEDRIVGVSGYAVRPARGRKEKTRGSAFISADV